MSDSISELVRQKNELIYKLEAAEARIRMLSGEAERERTMHGHTAEYAAKLEAQAKALAEALEGVVYWCNHQEGGGNAGTLERIERIAAAAIAAYRENR